MEIGRIEGATRVLGKSQGYYGLPVRDEAKNLGDLPHMLHVMGANQVDGECPTMQTVWFPSPDEIERIRAGVGIYVSLAGIAHPPIMVSIGDTPDKIPFPEEPPNALDVQTIQRNGWPWVTVTFNGEPVKGIRAYNIAEGWIVREVLNLDGTPKINGENFVTERVAGVVTARWRFIGI